MTFKYIIVIINLIVQPISDPSRLLPDTGIAVHGRHVETVEWDALVWGSTQENKMGSLPTAARFMLDEGIERINVLTMGTGASQLSNGTIEAKAMHDVLVSRFDELEDFPSIAEHPRWIDGKERVRDIVGAAVLDVTSKNTPDEIFNSARLFTKRGVKRVIHITNGSHAARVANEAAKAKQKGIIPAGQIWMLATDDYLYKGATPDNSAVVFEYPHRGDDSSRDWPEDIIPVNVLRKYFGMNPDERKKAMEHFRDYFEDIKTGKNG